MNVRGPETEPELLALQAAIRDAADRDDAAGMAAGCLAHARKAREIAEALSAEGAELSEEIEDLLRFEQARANRDWIESMSYIASIVAHRKQFAKAKEVISLINPDFIGHKQYALLEVIQLQIEAGEISEAWKSARLLKLDSARVGAYCAFGRAATADSKAAEAEMAYSIAWKCALRNQDKLHRIFELCDIVVQEKSARRTDAYYRYVQRERDSVKRCENYYWLVSPLTSEGRFAEAIDAINRMDIQQNRDSCLAEVAERQVYAGDIEGATVTVNAIQSPESQTRAMAYVETLRACRLVEQGAIEEGKQIFASLSTQAASITDDYVRSVITGAVLDGQAKLGFWDDAITTAKQSDNLWRIMELQSRNGLFSEAKAFSERYGLTISALSSIAADEMRAGQINNARKTFQQAIHLAQSAEHDLARYWSLFSVASQQFAGGDTAYAEQTLDCAWEISSRIQSKHNYDLWNRQVQMGCRYAENGLVEQVIRRNEEVFWWRDCHLHAVVQALKRYVDKKPKEGKVIQSSSLNTLLISCAYYSSATFAACSLLADLYPEQAAAVGHALAKDEADHRAPERGLPALVKNVTALFRKKSAESSTG